MNETPPSWRLLCRLEAGATIQIRTPSHFRYRLTLKIVSEFTSPNDGIKPPPPAKHPPKPARWAGKPNEYSRGPCEATETSGRHCSSRPPAGQSSSRGSSSTRSPECYCVMLRCQVLLITNRFVKSYLPGSRAKNEENSPYQSAPAAAQDAKG